LGFVNVQEYIEYLQTFPFEGVGISGGEPFRSDSVIVTRSAFGELALSNRISALLFDSLLVANHELEQVVEEMAALFPADDMERAAIREDIRQFYLRFENLEYLPRELPDYQAMELTEDRP
jgi:hypothetical protein